MSKEIRERRSAPPVEPWLALDAAILQCRRCERLVEYCAQVAEQKRASYRDEEYWGRPVPNFGDHAGRLLIVGLAPGAHGSNRTGRMFTGDRAGDFLFTALHAAGFANQPESRSLDDGLVLRDAAITAAGHCAPPGNKPLPEELANCAPFLDDTFKAMTNLAGVIALGKIGFDAVVRFYLQTGRIANRRGLAFAHGAHFTFERAPFILATYHPSQQNTFTGLLTMEMLVEVFERAKQLLR